MRSAFLNAAYNLSSHWELSVDGRYSSRDFESTFPQPTGSFFVPDGNAFNHLGGPVRVAYDLTPDVGPVVDNGRTETSFISTGIKGTLSRDWQLRASTAYSKSSTRFFEYNSLNIDAINAALSSADPATALNLFGDGSYTAPAVLAALRNQSVALAYPNEFTTTMGSVIADGPLLTGPAGPIRLAVGGDFRREHSVGFSIPLTPETRSRDIAAAFAELAVPLVGAQAGSTLDRLGLSLAGRYDHYSDVGSTFNPKFGMSWRPSHALRLRGNWGTSFRAPPFIFSNPNQIGDVYILASVIRSLRPGLLRTRAIRSCQGSETGDVDGLVHRRGRGAAGDTESLPVSDVLRYRLQRENSPSRCLQHDLSHPGGVLRLADHAQSDTSANRRSLRRRQARAGSIGNCSQPIAAILDYRFLNLASVRTRGVDFTLDYAIDSARGKWTFGLNGTYTFLQEQQITPTAPVFDFVNTVGNPLKLRMAAHLSWSMKGWTVLTTVNHTGAYQDPGSVPARGVDSWTTVDLNVGYRLNGGHGWLADTQCNLGVNNLFDQAPPFVNQYDQPSGNLGYDAANASLLGRQISLQIVKRWGR